MVSYISSGLSCLNYNLLGKTALYLHEAMLPGDHFLLCNKLLIEKAIELSKSSDPKDPNSPFLKADKNIKYKLRELVKKHPIDPKRIKFIVCKGIDSTYGAMGSLKYNAKVIICIESEEYKKLQASKELPADAQFNISHELGHLINDDHGDVGKRKAQILKICSLAVGTITSLYLSYSDWGYLSTFVGGWLAKGAFSKLVEPKIKNWLSRRDEMKADAYAALQGPEVCKKAIAAFETERKKGLKIVSKIKEELPNDNLTSRVLRKLAFLYYDVDELGNKISDKKHPLLTERIAFFESKIKSQ